MSRLLLPLSVVACLLLPVLATSSPVHYAFVVYASNPTGVWTIAPEANMTCSIATLDKGRCGDRPTLQCATYVEAEQWRVSAFTSQADCVGAGCAVDCLDTSGRPYDPAFYALLSPGSVVVPLGALILCLSLITVAIFSAEFLTGPLLLLALVVGMTAMARGPSV